MESDDITMLELIYNGSIDEGKVYYESFEGKKCDYYFFGR